MVPVRQTVLALLSLLSLLLLSTVGAKSACTDEKSCSLNGLCTGGRCVCDPAWTGDHCQTLHLIAGNKSSG